MRILLAMSVLWWASIVSIVVAEPLTAGRISELPADQQTPWRAYLDRSIALAKADADALAAEVKQAGLEKPIKAPSGGDFKMHSKPDDYFSTEEAKTLADSILSFQTPSGGWSKHMSFTHGPRKPGMLWTSQNEPGQPAHYLATFDNNSTIAEMVFLANIYNATKRDDCKAAFFKGLEFIFAAQYPNGGWPQVFPLEGGYHDDITFNDDAMTHVLELLAAIVDNDPRYGFVDDALRKRCAEALAKGLDCIMQSQITLNDARTAWCAQHDMLTLKPSNARKMEPAALSGLESAHILEFLMTLKKPSPALVQCIEAGLKWLEQAKVTNVARVKKDGKTVYEVNPGSTETYWARFYDLTTGQPIFPGRDGVIYKSFEEMMKTNELGYDYFSTQPNSIVNTKQKKWRKMLEKQGK